MDITVWYLSTCTTCKRILEELSLKDSKAVLIDIKNNPVSVEQLEILKNASGSYRSLINGRCMQFRKMDKKASDLTEEEARNLILTHYAFLKRPIIKVGTDIFVGNSKKTILSVNKKLKHD